LAIDALIEILKGTKLITIGRLTRTMDGRGQGMARPKIAFTFLKVDAHEETRVNSDMIFSRRIAPLRPTLSLFRAPFTKEAPAHPERHAVSLILPFWMIPDPVQSK
jgi:hypothetical protein